MSKRRDVKPDVRKSNFLARAYGVRVPEKVRCKECGCEFKLLQRFTELDELDRGKSVIMSDWLNVKLHMLAGEEVSRDGLCFFFYFDCPECFKRMFTNVYDSNVWNRLESVGYWSTLLGFEYGHIDSSNGSVRASRSKVQSSIDMLKKHTVGSYVRDSKTGLYSMVDYYG